MKYSLAIIAFSVALVGCDSKPKDTAKQPENVEVRVVTLPSETVTTEQVGDDYVADDNEEESEHE